MKKLAIIGSALTGGAAQIIDAVRRSNSYEVTAIFDNNPHSLGQKILNVPVIASSFDVYDHWKGSAFEEVVIAIGGDLSERQRLFDSLQKQGIPFANVIDPTADIRSEVKLGIGNVILANVFLGPYVTVGDNCYIITNTCINHDTIIGSHVYFSAGCVIAGSVKIGDRVRFDTASGAKAKISVNDDKTISAGKILIESV